MAQFCTKCGSPLADGMQFCTGCGATVGQPQGAMARPPAPAAPSPVAAPAAVPPARPSSGSPIVKIILIVLALFMFLGILGMGACLYIGYRAKQRLNQFQKQVTTTFPMPSGTREVHTQPSAPSSAASQPSGPPIDTGIAVYPGATPEGQGESFTMGTITMKVQNYTTSDSAAQVIAFYKDKLGSNAMVFQSGNQASLQLTGSNGFVQVIVAPDSSSGKTKITIHTQTK